MGSTAVVSTEFRFQRTPDGRVWTQLSNGHDHWVSRFAAFDHITMVVRVAEVPTPPPGAFELTGPRVSVAVLPDYRTPFQLVRWLPSILKELRTPVLKTGTLIAELPSSVSNLVLLATAMRRRPFAVTVVGDPDVVFSDARVGGALRAAYRVIFTVAVRLACRYAVGVAYVASCLEQKYPPSPEAVVVRHSSFIEVDDAGVPASHPGRSTKQVVTVGSLEQPYKGVADVLDATSLLLQRGYDLHLTVIGDGRLRPSLERKAKLLGLEHVTTFTGWLSGEMVRGQLQEADLFVLASHTEGMPRALLEAMAQGLPCVATRVGGIPDVLPEPALVDARAPDQLAERIGTFLSDPAFAGEMAGRNLDRVAAYRPGRQRQKLTDFYRAVHAAVVTHTA